MLVRDGVTMLERERCCTYSGRKRESQSEWDNAGWERGRYFISVRLLLPLGSRQPFLTKVQQKCDKICPR